ncbi:3-hydroxyacyl-ACP dehydratase FabZ family protein [Helicobacter labetoulli]|uniref:3-hydroxyacyl-ACP dehydratase FabZ family protein n=1 Tax=Helicobacter labetoulli TaxID=2315333 RepID=UPI0013004AB7|nr:3-hydroxyacyl-ACP dehydratase FabZ family protein [Helicobacter labetoulli]
MMKDLDVMKIREYIPLTQPSLMIDFVEEVEIGKYARGYKNFTYTESFFSSHFLNDPSVPSGVIIDCMSQMLLMTFLTLDNNKGSVTACLKIDNVEFRQKIIPGNRLDLEARLDSYKRGVAKGSVNGYLHSIAGGGVQVCRANFVIAIPEILQQVAPKGKEM